MDRRIVLQYIFTNVIESATNRTWFDIDTSFLDKVVLFVLCQLMPIPPSDDIVQFIGHTLIVNLHTIDTHLAGSSLVAIVGIEAWLYVEQLQLAIRACRDGQRNLHLLRVGCRRTCVCGYHLIVDVYLTLNEPVVGRRCNINTLIVIINAVVGITVIDDTLRLMDEVTRGLVGEKFYLAISINFLSQRPIAIFHVIRRKQCIFITNYRPLSMFITGIDITTTFDVFLHIDKVELDHTGDVTIDFLRRCAVLGSQFQIHTRSQGHLIIRRTIISITLRQIVNLILIISLGIFSDLPIVHISALIIDKAHITGQVTQIVHNTIDTEIIAVDL